jgi:hypothetical protein
MQKPLDKSVVNSLLLEVTLQSVQVIFIFFPYLVGRFALMYEFKHAVEL